MIIDLCGIPASGKSTFAKQLAQSLNALNIPNNIIRTPRYYPQYDSSRYIRFRGIILGVINIFRSPYIAYIVLRETINTKDYKRAYLSLQYYINWYWCRKKLNGSDIRHSINILDGSAINITNDYPSISLSLYHNHLSHIYKSHSLIIMANPDVETTRRLMFKRKQQPTEMIMYGNERFLAKINTKMNKNRASINERFNLNHLVLDVNFHDPNDCELAVQKVLDIYTSYQSTITK